MALEQLTNSLKSLSKSVLNFKIGAISIADLKPFDEQLTDIRQILKVQRAHSLLFFAKDNSKSITEKPQEDINTSVNILHREIANLHVSNMIVTLCLYSCSSEDIYKDKLSPELKKQIQGCMRKLFMLNDTLISFHTSTIEALKTEIRLQIGMPKLLLEYKLFLKEQESLREEKLQEINPEILNNKKKVEKKIVKINTMKRLNTIMIATASDVMVGKPFLFEMLKKHRELINIETIIEMGRNPASLNIDD